MNKKYIKPESVVPINPNTGQRENYSLHFRKCVAAYMAEQGAKQSEIILRTGLSKQTVQKVRRGEYDLAPEVIEAIRSQESNKLTKKFNKLIDAMTDEKIDSSTLPQIAVAAGIMFDKRQILEQKPTVILEQTYSDARLDAHEAELKAKLEAIQEKIGALEIDADYSSVEEGEVSS